jgi:hypothetical protein
MGLGPIAPFILAVPFLLISLIIIGIQILIITRLIKFKIWFKNRFIHQAYSGRKTMGKGKIICMKLIHRKVRTKQNKNNFL